MRNFVSYWEEHRKELGNGQPFEYVGKELLPIFQDGTRILRSIPFSEGILFEIEVDVVDTNKESGISVVQMRAFFNWERIATIMFR